LIIEEQNMKANVGGIDKVARIVVGLTLIMLALTGTIGAWGWVGVVPLATGLFNFCPLYPLLGISTCKNKQ
jgi:membrane-associated protease RseP (regulator of RpoE activity)